MESSKEKLRNARYRTIAFVVAITIHFALYMLVQQMMTNGAKNPEKIAETMVAEVSK